MPFRSSFTKQTCEKIIDHEYKENQMNYKVLYANGKIGYTNNPPQNLVDNYGKQAVTEITGHTWYQENENKVLYLKVNYHDGNSDEILYSDKRIKLNTYIQYMKSNLFDIAYIRKSKKGENSISLQMQINAIANNVRSLENLVILNEGFRSGKDISGQRVLNKFINHASYRNDYNYLYVYDVSRFTRDATGGLYTLNTLYNNNYIVSSVTENIEYNLSTDRNEFINKKHQFLVKLNDASRDLALITIRAIQNIKHRRERGDYIGRPPYGKKIQKINGINKLVVNPNEEYNTNTISKYRNTKTPEQLFKMLKPCRKHWTIEKLRKYLGTKKGNKTPFANKVSIKKRFSKLRISK